VARKCAATATRTSVVDIWEFVLRFHDVFLSSFVYYYAAFVTIVAVLSVKIFTCHRDKNYHLREQKS